MNEDIVTLVAKAKDEASAVLGTVDSKIKALGVESETTATKFLGLNDAMKGIAGGLVIGAAIAGVTEVLHGAVEAAIEDEKTTARLTASLQQNAAMTREQAAAVAEGVKANVALGFTQDELKQSLGTLITGTHNLEEAQRAQGIAEDLARFKGISLQEASQALVAVEGGRYRSLAQLGIKVKDLSSTEEALAQVQKVVGGQAEEYANTTAGKLTSAQTQFNEAMENLGRVLLPLVAAAFQGIAAGLTAIEGLFKGVGDAIGGVATGLTNLQQTFAQNKLNTDAAKRSNDAYNAAVEVLHRQLEAGQITFLQYRAAVKQLTDKYDEATAAGREFTGGAEETGAGLDNVNAKAIAAAQALNTHNDALDRGSAYYRQFTTDAGETGAGLDNVQGRALAAAHGLDVTTNATGTLAGAQGGLQGGLGGTTGQLSGVAQASASATYGLLSVAQATYLAQHGAGLGALASGMSQIQLIAQGIAAGIGNVSSEVTVTLNTAVSHATGASHKISSAAKQAAKEATDAIKQAFQTQEEKAKAYAKTVHDQRMKEIKDAHEAANAAIAEERRAVDARLAERKKLNAAPVTAAEQALADRQAAQQERDLREALAKAQAGTLNPDTGQIEIDATAVRDAQEALQNFLDQQAIDKLKVAQAAADAQAEADAKAAQDQLDAKQKAEDKNYQAQVDAENKRYKDLLASYEAESKALEAHLLKIKASHATAITAIEKMYADFVALLTGQQQYVKVKALAGGGTAVAGGAYLVGENGPEMFYPRDTGTVVPNGAGGNINIHPGAITVTGAGDPSAVADQVLLKLRREVDRQGTSLTPSGVFARGY